MTDALLKKAHRIDRFPSERGGLSVGELIIMAVILDKPQWLKETGLTLAQCLDRLEPYEFSSALEAARRHWCGEV